MQTLSEIRSLLAAAGRQPRKRLGQHFLIDANLMSRLLDLAGLTGEETVLEVGPATGSLTEELLRRARRVVAVEADVHLAEILQRRLGGNEALTVLARDVLAGKRALAPEVLELLSEAPQVDLMSNLPYHVAVPVIVNCLLSSWAAVRGRSAGGVRPVCFRRLTFTVQRELAERLTAGPGGGGYGPASVVVGLLARVRPGRSIPPAAFWPRPKVHSQMLSLDFDPAAAERLRDAPMLEAVLSAAFGQRRKKIAAVARRRGLAFSGEAFLSALGEAGVDPDLRPEQVPPGAYRDIANILVAAGPAEGV